MGEELCEAGYWVRHVREGVRFADGVGALWDAGARRFLELGPDGVLSALVDGCLEEREGEGEGETGQGALVAPAVRAGRDEARGLLEFLARVDCGGVDVDWGVLFAGEGARRVDLPTYAFQRQRYWLEGRPGMGDLDAAGLAAAGHPLLGAAVRVAAERDGWLFTGRLSLASHGWLADHTVFENRGVAGYGVRGVGVGGGPGGGV